MPLRNRSKRPVAKNEKRRIGKLANTTRLTIGLDLGDRHSRYCILNEDGEVVSEAALPTTKTGLSSLFREDARVRPGSTGGGDAFAMGEPATGGVRA